MVLMIWVLMMTDVMTSVWVVRQAEEMRVVIAVFVTGKKKQMIVAKKIPQFWYV